MHTVFTRILSGSKSLLIAFAKAIPVALLTEVGREEAVEVLPIIAVTLTIALTPSANYARNNKQSSE